MGRLDNKVALVTGCARAKGVGRAVAVALAAEGADVAVADLTPAGTRNLLETDKEPAEWQGLESVVDEIRRLGRRAVGLIGDVGLKADAERLVAETIGQLGGVDVLVNNAAAPQGGDRNWTWEVSEDDFDTQLRVNTKGVFLMSGAVIRHWLARGSSGGRIINIGSTAGKQGQAHRAAYCASKFAVIGLTQTMALELAPRGITVNVVCAGPLDTARGSSRRGRSALDGARAEHALSPQIPVGREGTPADIARAVLFLADPSADFITGQSVNIDGGLVLH